MSADAIARPLSTAAARWPWLRRFRSVTEKVRGFNLNTVAIILAMVISVATTLVGGAVGVAKIVFVVTTKADAINSRLDNVELRLSRAEAAAAEAKGAAAEAEKTSTAMIRELRYKEEQDQNRELRQTRRRTP